MNVQPKPSSLIPETVTTGPLTGSRKVYATPKGYEDVHVPFREIVITDPAEPPCASTTPPAPTPRPTPAST
jgi:phosphomethylpyrimidine synthase